MFSFTGFSSTTDLTENSSIAYTIDNDVGNVVAILVEKNADNNFYVAPKESKIILTNYFLNELDKNYTVIQMPDDKVPRVILDLDNTIQLKKSVRYHRLARDSFTS